jgi:ATP-dependent DNA helicase DinG
MSEAADELTLAMGAVAASLPGGGEERPGQLAMARAVARALSRQLHLVVQAGTGTGKSLAYLLPLVLSGRKAVVATATKNLQDQLAGKDLPQIADALGASRRVRFAVLKGRANYLCRQRVSELRRQEDAGSEEVALFEPVDATSEGDDGRSSGWDAAFDGEEPVGGLGDQLRRLVTWAEITHTGDRADLPFEPHRRAWASVSVTARECPGAFRCPSGPDCFTELARARAAAADVVVVNTHLYAAHLASGGAVLPEHDVVVFDEAHAVEDVMTDGLGLELTPGRLRAAVVSARGLLGPDHTQVVDGVTDCAARLDVVLEALVGQRVLRGEGSPGDELSAVLELATGRVGALLGALRRTSTGDTETDADTPDTAARRARAVLACSHLLDDLAALAELGTERVAWVEASGPGGRWRTLRAAPVDVGQILSETLWPTVTGVLTSATVPPLLTRHLGLPDGDCEQVDVGSPFPYATNALLYCAAALPDRRGVDAEPALHAELRSLMEAAGGRTLALFTSWGAMRRALDALRPVMDFPLLGQGELPKSALLRAFTDDEASCLFATMSFWQGVDVPGPSLSLVAVDRLPFPRPDDPLLDARRERAGEAAFREVDLPRAATLLAQGAGRLIRSSTDCGVVAVLDRRLATAGYGRQLRAVLPPMRFTTDRRVALDFLARVTAGRDRPVQ